MKHAGVFFLVTAADLAVSGTGVADVDGLGWASSIDMTFLGRRGLGPINPSLARTRKASRGTGGRIMGSNLQRRALPALQERDNECDTDHHW